MSTISTRVRGGRLVVAGALVASALFVGACGSSSSTSSDSADTSSSASSTGAAVVIDTFMFSPKALHVKVGDTVTWTNHDNITHTVTSGTREYEAGDSGHVTATHKDGLFDTPLEGKGATATHTFTKTGTFHYFCDRHPGMEADVDVDVS